MNKFKKLALLTAATAITVGAVAGLAACADGGYTITKSYTSENASEIPDDMVNKMMYASEFSQTNVTVTTKLNLDSENLTYTLYKSIITDQVEMEEGVKDYTFKGEWEFTGTYTVSESNANDIVLKVPTSGKYNCYYPTVLNYQSVEKQTQDWVSSADYPALLTRFNKWYPSKAAKTVDQPVTLDGKTMTFGEVDLTVDTPAPGEGEGEGGDEEEVDMSGWGLDAEALVAVGAGGKALNFYADGTYKFVYNFKYGETLVPMIDNGTWTLTKTGAMTLTVTPEEGDPVVCSGQVDGSGKLALHYVYSANSVITEDFELTYSQWSPLMPKS